MTTSIQNCPNCNKPFNYSYSEHDGWGAGSGSEDSGTTLCKECKQGHIDYTNDDVPGFRDHWSSNCCNCGINLWVVRG